MAELALEAGVSPATPYNLAGSKADLMRMVVEEEFRSFIEKLAAADRRRPLQALLDATALVVTHYEADRDFYRALYRVAFNSEARDVHDVMRAQGQKLWRGLVAAATEAGELGPTVQVGPVTDVLLRAISSATLGWLSEDWPHARFEMEMSLSVRLPLAILARPDLRTGLIAEIDACQSGLARLEAAEPAGSLRREG